MIWKKIAYCSLVPLLLTFSCYFDPVVDDQNRLLGIVTEYNLMQSVTNPDVKSQPVKSIMTSDVITVDEDTIPLRAVGIMQKHRIRRIPVVCESKLVGVIARRDLLRYVKENEDVLRGFLDQMNAVRPKE